MCATTGIRSVSALAREAIQRIIYDATNDVYVATGVDERLRDLDARLRHLQRDVSYFSDIVTNGLVIEKKE